MITKGTISKKLINGKEYFYHQFLIDGKQVTKSINKQEAYTLAFQIYYVSNDYDAFINHRFNFNVIYGGNLYLMADSFSHFKKRFCYSQIEKYLNGNDVGKVLTLYGLRRTGKTTLIFQSLYEMPIKDFSKSVYIKCDEGKTFYQLIDDLKFLVTHGIKYIFIDEVTLLDDFIPLSSTLSDIYGTMAKIVLSGTDSLGFLIASHNELYNRSIMVHTTYISFKEFAQVLGKSSIDEYIEYGGTMSLEGIDYNATITRNSHKYNEYVDSSISHNIVHSLKVHKDGAYFSNLMELYENNELENAINRIVEDVNHRFVISVIEKDFKSHDYGSLKQLVELPKNAKELSGVLNNVDEEKLTSDLMKSLNIINKDKQNVKITNEALLEIENFLLSLDVYSNVKEVSSPTFQVRKKNVFTQPGLRYSQAKELIRILLNDQSISKYPKVIVDALKNKLLSDVKGRMLEEIVLLELSNKNDETFKMVFDVIGEYDVVVLNNQEHSADIYEIKYSNVIDSHQYKNLIDKELEDMFVQKYYPIKNRYVLYRGENKEIDGIKYRNIEEYLIKS